MRGTDRWNAALPAQIQSAPYEGSESNFPLHPFLPPLLSQNSGKFPFNRHQSSRPRRRHPVRLRALHNALPQRAPRPRPLAHRPKSIPLLRSQSLAQQARRFSSGSELASISSRYITYPFHILRSARSRNLGICADEHAF